MRATTSGYFRAVVTSQSELADNRILYRRWESLTSPHTFLAAEARFDVDLFRAGNHQLSGGIHVVKGFATVFTVTHEYSVGSLLFDQRSHLEIQGDYVGFGISYRWGVGIPKKDFWKRRRGQYK